MTTTKLYSSSSVASSSNTSIGDGIKATVTVAVADQSTDHAVSTPTATMMMPAAVATTGGGAGSNGRSSSSRVTATAGGGGGGGVSGANRKEEEVHKGGDDNHENGVATGDNGDDCDNIDNGAVAASLMGSFPFLALHLDLAGGGGGVEGEGRHTGIGDFSIKVIHT